VRSGPWGPVLARAVGDMVDLSRRRIAAERPVEGGSDQAEAGVFSGERLSAMKIRRDRPTFIVLWP
jgi:hypothetical protein